ncbi:MAG: DUF1772 domain-containing protein [Bacteroidota bacterium]
MLTAAILYLIGTFGVTAFGNVPLNDKLDLLNLTEITSDKANEFRKLYEMNWNKLHLIRTICAVASFILTVLAAFSYSRPEVDI